MDDNTYELNDIIERLEEAFELDLKINKIVNETKAKKMDSAKLF